MTRYLRDDVHVKPYQPPSPQSIGRLSQLDWYGKMPVFAFTPEEPASGAQSTKENQRSTFVNRRLWAHHELSSERVAEHRHRRSSTS